MKRTAIATLSVALFLAGCAGAGSSALRNETEASVSTKISEGKTTKNEIRTIFGSPKKTDFTDSGLEVWRYEFENLSADAVNFIPVVNWFGSSASGKKKELVVLFDKSNVVSRYSMSESDVTRKTGIFNN